MKTNPKILIVLAAVGVAILIGITAVAFALHSANTASSEATQALCLLRHDKQVQIKSTLQFIHDHPGGIPGIPNKLLLKGVTDAQDEVKALSKVKCP